MTALRDIRIKKKPYLIDKQEQRRREQQNWICVRRAVDLRDKFICRACGRRVVVTVSAVPERREHHHVVPLSRGGEDCTANVVTLCATCHVARHVTRTLEISGNADKILRIRKVK